MLANKRNLAQQLTTVVQSTLLSMPQQDKRPPVLSSRLSTYLAFQAPDTKRTERAQSVRLRSAGAFQEQLQREQAQEGKKKKENQAHHHGDPVISAPAVALELNSGMAALCAWKQHRLGEVDGDRGKNIPGMLASQSSHSIISRLSESLSQAFRVTEEDTVNL